MGIGYREQPVSVKSRKVRVNAWKVSIMRGNRRRGNNWHLPLFVGTASHWRDGTSCETWRVELIAGLKRR